MQSDQKLIIQDIKIQNLRSYKADNDKIRFSEHTNVIVGLNGSGKSSILEGLAYVLTGKVPEGIAASGWVNQTVSPPFRAGAELSMKDMQNDRVYHIGKFMSATKKGSSVTIKSLKEQEELGIHLKPAILKFCLVCHEKQSQWMFDTDAQVTKIFNEILNTETYMNYSDVLGKFSNELQKSIASSTQTSGRGRKSAATQATQAIISQEQFIQAHKQMQNYNKIPHLLKNINFKDVKENVQKLQQMQIYLQNINLDISSIKQLMETYNIPDIQEQQLQDENQINQDYDTQEQTIVNQIKQVLQDINQCKKQQEEALQKIGQESQSIKQALNKIQQCIQLKLNGQLIKQLTYPDVSDVRTLMNRLQTENTYIYEVLQQQVPIQKVLQTEEQAQNELQTAIQNGNISVLLSIDNRINQSKEQTIQQLADQIIRNDLQKQNLVQSLNGSQHKLEQLEQQQHEQERSNEIMNNIQQSIDNMRQSINEEKENSQKQQDQVNQVEDEVSTLKQHISMKKLEMEKKNKVYDTAKSAQEQLNQIDQSAYIYLARLLKCYLDNGTYTNNNILESQIQMEQFLQSYNKIKFLNDNEKSIQLQQLLQNPDEYKYRLAEKQSNIDQQLLIKQYDKYLPNISQAYNDYLIQQASENINNHFIKDNLDSLVNIFNTFVSELHQKSIETIQDIDNDAQLYDFYIQYQYIFDEFKDENVNIIEIMTQSIQTLNILKIIYNQLKQQQMLNEYVQIDSILEFIKNHQNMLNNALEQIQHSKEQINTDLTSLQQQYDTQNIKCQQLRAEQTERHDKIQKQNEELLNLQRQLSQMYNNNDIEQQINDIKQQINQQKGQLQVYETNSNQWQEQVQAAQNDLISDSILRTVNQAINRYNSWGLIKIINVYRDRNAAIRSEQEEKQAQLEKIQGDYLKIQQYNDYYVVNLRSNKYKRQILEFLSSNRPYVDHFKGAGYEFLGNVNLATVDQHLGSLLQLFTIHSSEEFQKQQQQFYALEKERYEKCKSEFIVRTVNILCRRELQIAKETIQNAVKQFQTTSIRNVNLMLKDMWQSVYRPGNVVGSVESVYISFSDNEKNALVVKARVKGEREYEERAARNGLSSGQQVLFSILLRAALAKTFAKGFAMLCLDEPTNFLDRQHAEDLAIYLKRFADENGTQLIVVTHSEEFADALDRDGGVRRIVVEQSHSGSHHHAALV